MVTGLGTFLGQDVETGTKNNIKDFSHNYLGGNFLPIDLI